MKRVYDTVIDGDVGGFDSWEDGSSRDRGMGQLEETCEGVNDTRDVLQLT